MSDVPEELSKCMQDFTLDIYKYVVKSNSNENAFMSPSSVLVVMAMLDVGSKGATQEQMTKVLKFHEMEKDDIVKHFEKFVKLLKKDDPSFILTTANRLYPRIGKVIEDTYLSLVSNYFQADIKNMDYGANAEGSREEINKWVEEQTKNKITNLLPPGSLNALTAMVVVNAIYFKGKWATQFDANDTRKQAFFISKENKVMVNMMSKNLKKVSYGENAKLSCTVLQMPYEGDKVSMIFVLPTEIGGLSALEQKLTLEDLKTLIHDQLPTTVNVTIPKFKLELSLQLKKVLSDLGMPLLFDVSHADLSGIGKDLYVSEVYHKAFVDVNEEGTEAAAATGAVMMLRCAPIKPKEFIANHPFLFMIWDHRVNAPLFIGRLVNPA